MNSEKLKQQLAYAKQRQAVYKSALARWAKKKPKVLDQQAQAAHVEVFSDLDCLTCANCCKTTSPIFRNVDIERISKSMRVKPSVFIEQYLHIDSDGDYVLNSAPCPFLDSENYCSIYEDRPNACREYPHTDRKNFYQISKITLNNTAICPAVSKVLDKLIQAGI